MIISGISSAASAVSSVQGAGSTGRVQLDLIGKQQSSGEAASASGSNFGDMVMRAIERLDTTQRTADAYAKQAATGTLARVEDYLQAATESQLMTQLTVAVRNKAVEAYQEIMRMAV
jgi:flagellar hook-basal body complex protein FliE